MKVLWILNIIMPYPAKYFKLNVTPFGGWLNGMLSKVVSDKNLELVVVCPYDGAGLLKCKDKNIIYYLLPNNSRNIYNKKLKKYYEKIYDTFKPDIVHIHGTEFSHGLVFLENFSNVKSVVSIQGIMNEIANRYLAGIKKTDVILNITMRDIIRRDCLFQSQKRFERRAKFEYKILGLVDAAIGRTKWDREFCQKNFPNLIYYKCNENLRPTFYKGDIWSIRGMKRHTIMFSQITYPLKGFHQLLKALAVIVKKYPDCTVYVTGQNILDMTTLKNKIKTSGYAKYLQKLIKKYELQNHIIPMGFCNEEEVKHLLLKSNVYIQSSAIENSSNSLGEAMILGVPCIVSLVGGTSSMISNNEGLLYDFFDVDALINNIDKIFSDDELCITLGKNAHKRAIVTHDRDNNYSTLISIYKKVLYGGEKND